MSHITRSTLIIAFFFGMNNILAFVRQILIARQFQLTYDIDAFNVANNIPDLLSALISGGALGVALLPVLSEYLQKKGRRDAWNLFSQILNLAFFVTGFISLIIFLFARPIIVYLVAPGFPSPVQELAIELMRLDLIAILIFSISGLIMAGLQANQHFLLPAMSPGMYNLGQIFGVAMLAPETGISLGPVTLPAFGFGIYGLVYGVILGACLHLLIQVPGLFIYKFHWVPSINLRDPGMRKLFRLFGPRILTMFFSQVFFIYRDHLASFMGEGPVTALNYGWFFMQVPETLIGTALAIAILPTLAEQMARGEIEAFTDTVNRAVRVIITLTIPIAVLLAVGIRPIVHTLLGFDAAGTELVVLATRAYLLGLMSHALLEIAARSFYAQQDPRPPLIAAAINAGAYIVFATFLSRMFGHTGIALGNSIAFTFEAFFLLFLLNRRFPGFLKIRGTAIRVSAATALGAALVFSIMNFVPLPLFPLTLTAMVLGALVVVPFAWPEVKSLAHL
jgi:putative peptidoglycan lipid II flippase